MSKTSVDVCFGTPCMFLQGAARWRVTESSGEETSQCGRDVREMARTWCRLPHLDLGMLVHDARDRRDEEFRFNRRMASVRYCRGVALNWKSRLKTRRAKKK